MKMHCFLLSRVGHATMLFLFFGDIHTDVMVQLPSNKVFEHISADHLPPRILVLGSLRLHTRRPKISAHADEAAAGTHKCQAIGRGFSVTMFGKRVRSHSPSSPN